MAPRMQPAFGRARVPSRCHRHDNHLITVPDAPIVRHCLAQSCAFNGVYRGPRGCTGSVSRACVCCASSVYLVAIADCASVAC